MRFIETLKNIWKVEELRQRILTTLFFVLIYRLGSFIVIPGIDPNALDSLHKQTSSGLMALIDMFSGGRSLMPRSSPWGSCPTSLPPS